MPVFRRIREIIYEHPQATEIFIMFVSDGQDTFDGRRQDDPTMESILDFIKTMPRIETTYLSVGFSAHHDAKLMNKIANSGNQEGNFIYVDTRGGNY